MPDTRAPDAPTTMVLWTDLVESALRSDYPEPGRAQAPLSRPSAWLAVGATVAVITLIILIAAQTVLRDRPVLDAQRNALGDRITEQQARLAAVEETVRSLDAEVEALTTSILADDADATSLVARLGRLEVLAGRTEVTGAGVSVRLEDAEDGGELGVVMDRDLQATVNALWEAGATAIAVNGIRLTSTTAIRAAGEAILVGYRPLAPPYTIDAVGVDTERFAATAGARALNVLSEQFGIGVVITSGDRMVPAAGGP